MKKGAPKSPQKSPQKSPIKSLDKAKKPTAKAASSEGLNTKETRSASLQNGGGGADSPKKISGKKVRTAKLDTQEMLKESSLPVGFSY